MKITIITVCKTDIRFTIDNARKGDLFKITARVPIVCGDPDATFVQGRVVAEYTAAYDNNHVSIPRFAGDYDCIICAFEVFYGTMPVQGVRYVTEIDPSVPEYGYPYPKVGIKSLEFNCPAEDMDILDVQQIAVSPNQCSIMALHATDDTITYNYNGKPYYFNSSIVRSMDSSLLEGSKRGMTSLMRYINSSFFLGDKADDELVDIIQHPAFDYDYPRAFMGAFNVSTEQGLDYFCACTEFLAQRYSREDQKYGRSLSFEVGNEVTAHYVWNNAGEMTCDQAMLEYTTVLRLTWLLSCKHYANFRIHAAFESSFAQPLIPAQPKRFYAMRDALECIGAHCRREGDFPWNIAFHPYPENIRYPDFYNDRAPNFTFDTARITFKNIEVLPAYLAQDHMLYKGQPRRIIMPEQGFNTRPGEPFTEQQAAHAYCLAYLKIRKQPTIDQFVHHSYMDVPGEFGLNLGLRRFGGTDEAGNSIPGEPKLIYYVVRDMDTPNEAQRVKEAREFIGEELFDSILDPPPVKTHMERTKSLTIMGMGNKRGRDQNVDDDDPFMFL
jgi:hypothetical protein